MARQLLIYENATPVNASAHREMCVKSGANFLFSSDVNSVPLTAAEFVAAMSDYPIVFAGEGENIVPSAILGVGGQQNAFVDSDGTWAEGYIPGFIRRYPFVFSTETEDGRLILHIDESFEGCNTEGRGERLFDADGEQTAYLKGVLDFLQSYQAAFTRTQAFCKKLVDLDLLRPVEATFTMADGSRNALGGFQIVDREKLKSLKDEDAVGMLRTDELECVYAHQFSLRNFSAVADKSSGVTAASGKDVTNEADDLAETEVDS